MEGCSGRLAGEGLEEDWRDRERPGENWSNETENKPMRDASEMYSRSLVSIPSYA